MTNFSSPQRINSNGKIESLQFQSADRRSPYLHPQFAFEIDWNTFLNALAPAKQFKSDILCELSKFFP